MGKFAPLASLLGQIRQIFLLCVISSPLFSPDSHRGGCVQSKLCYGPGGGPRHGAVSAAALKFAIYNTGMQVRYHSVRILGKRIPMEADFSLQHYLQNIKSCCNKEEKSIQEKLSLFQAKQTLDSTSTSDVFCTIWGPPRSQRLRNGTPTAAPTTCFCKSKT